MIKFIFYIIVLCFILGFSCFLFLIGQEVAKYFTKKGE